MSEGNGIPSKAAIDLAVHAIAEKHGLIIDEKLDMAKVRNRLFEAIAPAKVLAKKERGEKAVQRPQLVAMLLPDLPIPEQFDHQPDPPLAEKVYGWFDTKVWGETKSSADSALQRLVGVNMGNGYVMCRTKIGKVDAVYITDNIDCIREDFTRPEADSINRKLKMATKNREMLVLRQPDNAVKYANEYNRALRAELATAATQMQLAVESVSGNHAEDEDDVVDENENGGGDV
jgi:hypothetical protein